MSSRYAAVKAPEVMTRMSSVIVFMVVSISSIPFQRVPEKLCLQADQKDSDARRAKNRRAEAYLSLRWSEAIERNEAYESFSAACWRRSLRLPTDFYP
jgi:hypothetical protein